MCTLYLLMYVATVTLKVRLYVVIFKYSHTSSGQVIVQVAIHNTNFVSAPLLTYSLSQCVECDVEGLSL